LGENKISEKRRTAHGAGRRERGQGERFFIQGARAEVKKEAPPEMFHTRNKLHLI